LSNVAILSTEREFNVDFYAAEKFAQMKTR